MSKRCDVCGGWYNQAWYEIITTYCKCRKIPGANIETPGDIITPLSALTGIHPGCIMILFVLAGAALVAYLS